MIKMRKKILIPATLLLLVFIYNYFLRDITATYIRDWVNGFGSLAPLAYIAVWVVLPIFFFPVPVLALAGGLSFGLLEGSLYTIIGAMINSSVMYYIAKTLSKDTVRNYLKQKMPKSWWDKFMTSDSRNSFLIVFICRLIPAMPYNVINYASGLAEIGFIQYTTATFIGILPGTVIFLNVGDKILDVKSPEFVISIVLVILLTVGSIVLGKKISKKFDTKS